MLEVIKTMKGNERKWQHKIRYKREIQFAAWFSLHARTFGGLVGDVLRRLVRIRIRAAPNFEGWEGVVAEDCSGRRLYSQDVL